MPEDGHDLTVVIPTRDRWQILGRTLDALRRQTVQGFETVVVVDGADQVVPELDDAQVVVKAHGGPGAARNAGVRASSTPLVLFLGDDMVPEPQLVEQHLSRHAAEPGVGVAVLGRVDWHQDVAANAVLRWLDWSASQFDFDGIDGSDAGFGRFYSCNVSLKRELFDKVGGFDEDFTYYYEDLDLGWRLGQAGMRLRYAPGARARHLHDYDLPAIKRRFAGIATGERMMAGKHSWFEPFFHDRVVAALAGPPAPRTWPLLVDALGASRVPIGLRRKANRWWYQQVGDPFLDVWEGERGLDELRAYLGDGYDEDKLRNHLAEVDREEHAAPSEREFYRTSRAYLYDLTAFAMSGTKTPYLRALRAHVPPGARVLDYGCGIGSDGLRLLELGYDVSFADFANPSVEFLRWRLGQRRKSAQVYDVEQHVPGGFDAVYCFDVIEHIDDPFAFLTELERRGRVVVVNFLAPVPDDPHPHKPLPIDALLDHVARQQLLHYRRYHGRSHLVIYRPRPARVAGRVRSRAVRALGEHDRVRALGARVTPS
jgi:glycosyltransferase involved in cell wall biosynthesis